MLQAMNQKLLWMQQTSSLQVASIAMAVVIDGVDSTSGVKVVFPNLDATVPVFSLCHGILHQCMTGMTVDELLFCCISAAAMLDKSCYNSAASTHEWMHMLCAACS